jgi:hypothetical protein
MRSSIGVGGVDITSGFYSTLLITFVVSVKERR